MGQKKLSQTVKLVNYRLVASGEDTSAEDETVALKMAAATLGNENKLIKGLNQKDVCIEWDDKSWVARGKDESAGRGRCEKLQSN